MNVKSNGYFSRNSFLRLSAYATVGGLLSRGSGAEAAAGPAVAASISIVRSKQNGALAPGSVGLSYEKSRLSKNFFTSANGTLIGCFRRLGSGVLRIGGNSVDQTTWTANGAGSISGQVSPADVNSLASFLQSTGCQVIYGINLGTGTPAAAAAEAAYVGKILGTSLYGFEIGNECDLYSGNGVRSAAYTLSNFILEWSAYAAAIHEGFSSAPLTGPASASNPQPWAARFASSEASSIRLLTQHYYRAGGSSPAATMSSLLNIDPYLVGQMLPELQSAVSSNGVANGYRIAETNSFTNGGTPNVSNAFGSALWAIDVLLLGAQFGSAGMNFHGGSNGNWNPPYTPLADSGGAVVDVMPIFYGLLFVSQIAPGPMYAVNISTTLLLSAYAISGNDGALYVAIVNKDPVTTAVTVIALGAQGSKAVPLVLGGSGLNALTGTTLGGAVVGNDGTWSPPAATPIPFTGTTLSVNVAPASAMLLKIT